jgi:hypothetical protein
MMKKILLAVTALLLSACASNDEPPVVSAQVADFNQELYVDLFTEEEEVDYEAYFFDSKGQRFLERNSSYSKLDTVVQRMIEQALAQAAARINNGYGELAVALEVSGGGSYRDDIITAAEQYIVSNPMLILRAQEADVDQVLGKILKQELDPFYTASDSDFDESAKISDLVLYILANEKNNLLDVKISALSKAGSVLGVTKSTVPLRGQTNQGSRFAFVKVPFSENSGSREFQLMSYPVSINEMFGSGSKSIAVTSVSLEQASNYCDQNNLRLTSPYVFEFARRKQQIIRPAGNAYEEIIAAVDYEDIDEPFYREQDRLELEDDDMANTFLVFNWNTERFTIVSNSYSSRNMTFRCFKQ